MAERHGTRGRIAVLATTLSLVAGAACWGQNAASGAGTANTCGYMMAGAKPAPGQGGGRCPKLGALLFELPLNYNELPILAKDPSGNDIPPYPARTDRGTIVLDASPRGAGVAVPGSAPRQAIGDVVAIADFAPMSSGDSRFGINIRCTFTKCLTVAVNPLGTYEIREAGPDGKPIGPVLAGSARAPAAPSRLVVEAVGSRVDAWLDGNHLATFTPTITVAGVVAFVDVADGVDDAKVRVSSFVGFAPA